ncbi:MULTISPECIES: GNAT family N-acetyltransferase [Variovorax]|uniref:GNAT family N-acetyltransferase n=1 Tax=Variovorax TaxID=34072 RepID=UPI00285768A4|nr:GNAT family N-acetyltransferase [Variovorax sp. 3319]MDR6890980.1 putative acetyltransferase [Variovorax sp. 3319]
MKVRPFKAGDEAPLLAVFRSAVHRIASRDYSAEQVQAWAPADLCVEEFSDRLRTNRPFVAVLGLEPVGFADLQPDGYIDQFFVSGYLPRRGTARLLMDRIDEEAAGRGLEQLFSHVSLTAEPFFASRGFHVVERCHPVLRGVTFRNALMRRSLTGHPQR